MADTKITSLTEKAAPLTGIEELAANDAGADRKILTGVIRGWPDTQIPYFTNTDIFLSPQIPGTTSVVSLTLAADRLYLVPIIIPAKARTYTKIRAMVTTLHASNFRLGAYAAVQDTGKPTGTAIFDSGDISAGTTGAKDYTISWTPTPGLLYYLAYSSGGTPIISACTPMPLNGIYMAAGSTSVGVLGGLRRNRTHAALGDETASTWNVMGEINANVPLIGIQ